MSTNRHLVGLLLGAEEDWPQAFEAIVGQLGVFNYRGDQHVIDTERVHISPFNLRDKARHEVVIDRKLDELDAVADRRWRRGEYARDWRSRLAIHRRQQLFLEQQ